jgi:hypothetical protein
MTVHVSVRSISALLLLSVRLLGLPADTFTLQPFTESGRGQ